ncbi:MAG: septation ring formation regulator EzrA [Erysipelotrichales bacterium]|nr:septation ring formation regulator EzrA [Erysipelotrichales bacterium]
MSEQLLTMITITYAVITFIVVLVIVFIVLKRIKDQYKNTLVELERSKNLIISGSILSELNKVEALINNKDLEEKYNYWKSIFKNIKDVEVPNITNEIITAEELLEDHNYSQVKDVLGRIEFNIYIAKSKAQKLLEDIKEITLSEQKNREIVTKLKTDYRTIFLQYNNNDKDDYSLIRTPLELQFENIDKLFSTFEMAMENNVYSEVGKIVRALDDSIGNLKIVIEEAPSIILMGRNLIPNRIKEVNKVYEKMKNDGFNLDYLNIEYNISESEKKVADVFDRLNVLNLEDSVFELRTIMDYFDSLYSDFDKERISKKSFDDYIRSVIMKCKKLKKIINKLSNKINDIKYSYDLTDDDVKIIVELKIEVAECEEKYDEIIAAYREKKTAYSKLNKEMDLVNARLLKCEDKLNYTLRSLGSLKEDEIRAREQLTEIKSIVKEARTHVNSFKLPVVPKNYYVELDEANEAIKNMVIELEKQPISIKTLNTRVDTARDLVLKVYNTSIEIIKTASMAENAIVYGNRYRPVNSSIDSGLAKAEREFFKGNFKSSLELAINSINVVEPGIYNRLLDAYKSEN